LLFRRFPVLETALTLLGGTLLLWFAWRYLRQARHWQTGAAEAEALTPREAFRRTLAILATNPKALTTWLVLISIFPTGTAGAGAIAVMIAGAAVVASLGHLGYALAFSTPAAARAYAKAGRWIVAGVGVCFGALGTSLIAGALGG
ncbi:MAG: LysE family transporter, partial [Pseudomonadota bacterium]